MNWKPQPLEVYRAWIDSILAEVSDELNDWESKFVDDMDTKVTMLAGVGGNLTEGQAEKLE